MIVKTKRSGTIRRHVVSKAFKHTRHIRKQLYSYALPSIVGMLIVGIQMLVDGIFVSRGVGALGLAAVNLSMPLISIMLSVCIMIVSGGVVIAGVAQGEGDDRRSRGYTTLTGVVLLLACLAMSAVVACSLSKLCYFMGADESVFPYMRSYLGIIGCGFLFYCIPNFTEAFNRLAGRPNWVFISGSICCVVNVVLDYFFVIRFGWGTKGAAIATCIANSSAAAVLLPNVRFGRICGSLRVVGRIFYNGSSEMFTAISCSITSYIFNIVLMRMTGPTGVAALTIVCYLNMIVNMSIFGLSQALYPLMSYQLGARNYRGIRTLLRSSLQLGGFIGIGTYLLVLAFKWPIVRAFAANDPELMKLAYVAATYVTLHYLASFFNIIASSFHTAVERPIESVVISVCRSVAFVMIPLFVLMPHIGVMAVWLSMPIAEALTLLVAIPLVAVSMRRLRKMLNGKC